MDYILYIIVIVTTIWAYIDSKKYTNLIKIRPWFLGILTFFFWLPSFPLYLTYKFLKYRKQLIDPNYQPNKTVLISLTIPIWIISLLILGYYFIKELSLKGYIKF